MLISYRQNLLEIEITFRKTTRQKEMVKPKHVPPKAKEFQEPLVQIWPVKVPPWHKIS